MKLIDIPGDRCVDVIADITPPILRLAEDKAVVEMLRKAEGKTPTFMSVAAKLPAVLKTHKEDIHVILATVNGVSVEEYVAQLNMVKLIRDVLDLLTDTSFADFFGSAQPKAGQTSSGSAQENTVEA